MTDAKTQLSNVHFNLIEIRRQVGRIQSSESKMIVACMVTDKALGAIINLVTILLQELDGA